MATDVEESDTDDHERPAPPKRQCTRLVSTNETNESLNKRLPRLTREPNEEAEELEYDEVERLAREKLSIWQECQVAKGFLDNTINCVVEDYILNPPVAYSPADDPQFRFFRGSERMEDTAVTMAIRNHGLDFAPVPCWSNEENSNPSRSLPVERLPMSDVENLPSSSAIFDAAARSVLDIDARPRSGVSRWNEDKMDETDREQDFLERAVAEAIKKKGLSALSVDYG